MKEIPVIHKECYIARAEVENETSNVGFRIANLIHILGGDNKLNKLSYYSNHVEEKSDDGKALRGSYGPRLRWWVGSDQLAEANKINVNMDDEKDMVKPVGVDQLLMAYMDLIPEDQQGLGLSHSSFVVRNPAIDFDETNDVPDLLSGTFYIDNYRLHLILNYEIIENVFNDLWAFSQILSMMAVWIHAVPGSLIVNGVIDNSGKYETFETIDRCCQQDRNVMGFDTEAKEFWEDMDTLNYLEGHIRCIFNKEVLINEDVDYESCIEMFMRTSEERFFGNYPKELLFALLIWALANKCDMYGEQHIIHMLGQMETSIKGEVIHMLKQRSCGLDLSDYLENWSG